jgi:hypothetical protein
MKHARQPMQPKDLEYLSNIVKKTHRTKNNYIKMTVSLIHQQGQEDLEVVDLLANPTHRN